MESIKEQLQLFVRHFGLLNATCRDECCGEQISMAQSHILFEVQRSPGSPMQRIAEELGLDVTTFSRQVKGLEEKGLVARRISDEDRRVVLLELTPAGTAMLEKINRFMAKKIDRIFAQMSSFEQETVTRSFELLNHALITVGRAEATKEGTIACCK
ncbi:MAG: MarR family transcriptional regulator [Oryzomonas sp.]|uniref:MarR family winged helix-turn-helix transcriptional regulator n=1 Tax=Oryzomonas sp. TaxID=2855186 RepID=UPI00283F0080|nr:MarR family transcriptional regulator [Oryzomonas sp.]MDR3580414.1 MarR family transcriptional regulator [Oryzomonas sp.]